MHGIELISQIFLNEAFAVNHDALVNMINNRRVVNLYYRGDSEISAGWRKIEPVAYGQDHGVDYLRAWQISGKTITGNNRWKFFRIDRIRNVNFAGNQTFDKMRPNYNQTGDKHLSHIYAIADFKNKQIQPPSTPGAEKGKAMVNRLKSLKEIFEL